MTENEKKKQYLKGYEKTVRRMKRSELKIAEMRVNRMSPSVILDGMPHASGCNDLSGYVALLDHEERLYIKKRYLCIKKCKEITDKIEGLENEDEKDVLLYRYIKLMKWEDICAEMNYSWRQTHYIHSRALNNFRL